MAQDKNQDKETANAGQGDSQESDTTASPAMVVMSPEDLAALVSKATSDAVTQAMTALVPIMAGAGGPKIEAPEARLTIQFTAEPGKHACSDAERKAFRKGAIVEVPQSSADRWIRRGVAEIHVPKRGKAA